MLSPICPLLTLLETSSTVVTSLAELAKTVSVTLTNEKERMLAMHVVRFPEALADAIADLLPNRMTDYLYELTDIFNSFYVECQVRTY